MHADLLFYMQFLVLSITLQECKEYDFYLPLL